MRKVYANGLPAAAGPHGVLAALPVIRRSPAEDRYRTDPLPRPLPFLKTLFHCREVVKVYAKELPATADPQGVLAALPVIRRPLLP